MLGVEEYKNEAERFQAGKFSASK